MCDTTLLSPVSHRCPSGRQTHPSNSEEGGERWWLLLRLSRYSLALDLSLFLSFNDLTSLSFNWQTDMQLGLFNFFPAFVGSRIIHFTFHIVL